MKVVKLVVILVKEGISLNVAAKNKAVISIRFSTLEYFIKMNINKPKLTTAITSKTTLGTFDTTSHLVLHLIAVDIFKNLRLHFVQDPLL